MRAPAAAPTRASVLLPKHQSTWETFAFPALMPHPLAYVFKRELLYIPFFGWAMARLDMIHIDRSKRAEAWNKVAEQGRSFMAKGHWVIMFPEGTRTPRGSAGHLQERRHAAGDRRPACRCVPIAVTSARCWPRKSFLLRPGVIDVSIGQPIPSRRPPARRADARGRGLDRGRDAPPRPRGLSPARRCPARSRRQRVTARRGTGQADPGPALLCSTQPDLGPTPCRHRERSLSTGRRPGSTRGLRHSPHRCVPPPAGRCARSGLGEHRIGYALRRARRRSIGFVVGPDGLSVSAPRWVGAARDRGRAAREGALDPAQAAASSASARAGSTAARIDWRDGTIAAVPRRAA